MTGLDTLYKATLWVVILGLASWGLGLVFVPEQVHGTGNTELMNPTTTATLGAVLIGLAIMLLFIATDQVAKLALAAAIAVAILVLMRASLMFGAEIVLVNTITLGSLVIGGAVAIIMFIKGTTPVATPEKK